MIDTLHDQIRYLEKINLEKDTWEVDFCLNMHLSLIHI